MSNDVKQQIHDLLQSVDELYQRGNYPQAIPMAEEACDLARNHLGDQHNLLAVSLESLARLLKAVQNYSEAEQLYWESIDIKRTNLGDSHPEIATSLNNFAEFYRQIGAYAQARPLYEEALEILAKAGAERGLGAATTKNNLALLYNSIGSYEEAANLFEESLEQSIVALGENHPAIATTKDNLGSVYKTLGNYERAEELHLQALDTYRATLGRHHPDVSICLNNLALVYKAQDKNREAIPLYEQAMEIDGKVLGSHSPAYAMSVHNLGFFYLELGDYVHAEPLLRKALEIRRKSLNADHPNLRSSLAVLSELCAATGRDSEAIDLMEQCIVIDERRLGNVFAGFSTEKKVNYLSTLRTYFDIFLSLIIRSADHVETAAQRGLALVLRRKSLSVEAMELPHQLLGNYMTKIERQYKQLIDVQKKLNRALLAGPQRERLWDYQQRVGMYVEEVEHLEANLIRERPEISLDQRLQKITLEVVAKSLPGESVLVEFVCLKVFDFSIQPKSKWRPPHYFAFLLKSAAPEHVQLLDLGEAEMIDALIVKFRTSVTGQQTVEAAQAGSKSSDDRNVSKAMPALSRHVGSGATRHSPDMDAGARLRSVIFDPLLAHLGASKRLILAPDGNLASLPFEILPLEQERFLVDEFQLSYVNVGREVLRFGEKVQHAQVQALVIADPDYDLGAKKTDRIDGPTGQSTDHLGLSRLPGTAREGEQVARLLNARLWVGKTALSSALKSIRSPHILHIATHGYFESQHFPMSGIEIELEAGYFEDVRNLPFGRSRWFWRGTESSPLRRAYLIFAGFNTWLRGGTPPKEAEEGVITAADVLTMDLQNTELVVLSACETGVGQAVSLEGVFGLGRAFTLAGAKTIVISLWQVPDQQTQELMGYFYEHLLNGLPREQALREAQLAMKAKNPDPLYWGAFICQGALGKISIH